MLEGKKTYIAAAGALLVAIGAGCQAFAQGLPIQYDVIVDALIAAALIFLRKGIKQKA